VADRGHGAARYPNTDTNDATANGHFTSDAVFSVLRLAVAAANRITVAVADAGRDRRAYTGRERIIDTDTRKRHRRADGVAASDRQPYTDSWRCSAAESRTRGGRALRFDGDGRLGCVDLAPLPELISHRERPRRILSSASIDHRSPDRKPTS
jgi:hypothetical protein